MFSASCSPVKISGSKQINAIFITIYISGTVISFGKTVSWEHKLALPPHILFGQVGVLPQTILNVFFVCLFVFFFFNAVNRHLVFGKYEIAKKFL